MHENEIKSLKVDRELIDYRFKHTRETFRVEMSFHIMAYLCELFFLLLSHLSWY
jgi:hypothetical protein